MSKNQVGHKNRKHVRAEEKWFSRENIRTTFPLNNGCKNRPTLNLNERKKKRLADKTYEQRFLFTSIEAFVFQKIKRRRRRRN